jgi:hypothetical protein
MPWLRFILYFIAVAFITWALTQMEIASPGSLKLHIILNESDRFGTSEFSPVEIIQAIILGFCGLTMWWVARFCTTQRPVAILFGGMALIFLIRELDYFLDRFVMDNFWQLITVIVGSLLIAYTYRHRRRIQIALARIWPSPGLTLLFAGALILFAFVRFVGHAVEEFIELIGYFLWMIGTIEYAFQARAIAMAQPQPAARRRRDKRRHDAEGKF